MELTKRHGMNLTDRQYRERVHARSNEKIVRELFGSDVSQEVIDRIADKKESLYRRSFAAELKEIPGLGRLLEELDREGIGCAAASNSPVENVDFVLDGLGIRKFFRVIINRDQVSEGKPNPQILLKAADGLGFEPGRCFVFEDSASGFKAARTAGMRYAAITAGTDPAELAEAFDAAGVFEDFSSITPQLCRSWLGI